MSKTEQRKQSRYQKFYKAGYQDRTRGFGPLIWPAMCAKAEFEAYKEGYIAAAAKVRIPSQVLKKRSRWCRFIHWLFLI
jgi:hypothetical protein